MALGAAIRRNGAHLKSAREQAQFFITANPPKGVSPAERANGWLARHKIDLRDSGAAEQGQKSHHRVTPPKFCKPRRATPGTVLKGRNINTCVLRAFTTPSDRHHRRQLPLVSKLALWPKNRFLYSGSPILKHFSAQPVMNTSEPSTPRAGRLM